MNKALLITIPVFLIAAFLAYRLAAENRELEERISSLQARMTQQLEQVEESSRQRLALQNQLDELRSELTESRSRLTALGTELDNARQQVDPDYERVEQEIRQQLAREYAQQNSAPDTRTRAPLSRAQLIDELSGLEPMEMAQLMTLQGRYGEFLESLNVDNQRKEVIIDALNNYLTDQNNARRDIMMQAQADGFDRRQMREQMQVINSPETRRESLSYALTEDELLALEQFEQNQPQNVSFRVGNLQRGDGAASAVFIGDGNYSLEPGQEPREYREVIITNDQ